MLTVISMLMGAMLGFSAHRAGLCTVKAVDEVLTLRRGRRLWSFTKSIFWVMALTTLAGALSAPVRFQHWPASGLSMAGGMLFGLGAGINGGCVFSSLSRLMDGSLKFLGTVLMWPVGIQVAIALKPSLGVDRPVVHIAELLPLWMAVLLGFWALREYANLARSVRRAGSIGRYIGAPIYSLSAGAALVGGTNAVLLISIGPWSFTGTLLCAMKEQTVARCDASSVTPLLVLAAALSGMALSSWQRKLFHLQCSRPRLMLRHAAGGLLMGFGEALIPGGNDGLILFGIPSLSPHAIPAYAGVLAGVATALLTLRGLVRNDLISDSEQSVIIDPLLVSPHLSKEGAAREQNSTLPSQSPASIGSRRTRP